MANGLPVAGTIHVSSTEQFATFFYDEPLPSSTEVKYLISTKSLGAGSGWPFVMKSRNSIRCTDGATFNRPLCRSILFSDQG